MKNKNKITIIALIIGAIALGGGYLYCKTNIDKPFKVKISQNEIKIIGWWGATINSNNIKSVDMINPPLDVDSQDMGGKIGNKIFGNVNLNNYGKAKCFVENASDKAIEIKTKKENYILNFSSNEETLKEYNKIKKNLKLKML